MKRFVLAGILTLIVGSLFYPQQPAQALVCTYTTGSQDVCQPFDDEISPSDAGIRCALACRTAVPACTKNNVLDVCPQGARVIPVTSIQPPFSFANSPQQLIGRILRQVIGILGALTFLVFSYGGFMWVTSGGNEEKVTHGTQAMIWAVVGLFVVFSSYILVNVLFTSIAAP